MDEKREPRQKEQSQDSDTDQVTADKTRRRALGTMLGVSGAAATTTSWVSPVIESVTLPAHAQTTGLFEVSLRIEEADDGTNTLPRTFAAGDYTVPFGDEDGGPGGTIDDPIMIPQAVVTQGESVNLDTSIEYIGADDGSDNFDFADDLPTDETQVANTASGLVTFSSQSADDGARDATQRITWRFAKDGAPDQVIRITFTPDNPPS